MTRFDRCATAVHHRTVPPAGTAGAVAVLESGESDQRRSTVRRLVFVILSIGCHGTALAYDPSWPGPKDFPLLPPYCKPIVSQDAVSKEERKAWYPRLGAGYGHAHHYCAGLNFLRRAGQPQQNKSDRPALLKQAINEFNYMVTHAEPDGFVLMPEVYVNRGRAHSGLNNSGAAIGDFMRAIELRPDWPGGYLALADFYQTKGMLEDARKTLSDGIEKCSETTALKSRLAALDKNKR